MPTITEVRERVDAALKKMNLEQMTIPSPKGDLVVTLDMNRYRYDRETHLNAVPRIALNAAIESFAIGEIDERQMKEAIGAYRDSCEIIYLDQRFLIHEPSLSSFVRYKARFDVSHGARTIPIERSPIDRIDRLTRKVFALFSMRKREYQKSLIQWKTLEEQAHQCKRFAILSQKLGVNLSEEEKAIFAECQKILAKERYEIGQMSEPKDYDESAITLTKDEPITTLEESITIEAPETEREPTRLKIGLDEFEATGTMPVSTKQEEKNDTSEPTIGERRDEAHSNHSHLCPECRTRYGCDEVLCKELESLACKECFAKTGAIRAEPEAERDEQASVAAATRPPASVRVGVTSVPHIEQEMKELAESMSKAGSTAIFERRQLDTEPDEELTDEDKALASQVEDDGEEDDFEEPEQGGLFGDISVERVKRKKMFSNALLIDTAFEYHRREGFPYRDHPPAMMMAEIQKLAEIEGKALISSPVAYQVADSFHKHRFHAAANGMKSPFESFNDDKKLRKAIKLELTLAGKPRVFAGGMMTLVNGTQACSNFRPGFACYLYREYCPDNAVVLDTSTGYGGRLIGAVASQKVSTYIGIDPNVPTYEANCKMIRDLHLDSLMSFELINLPAEDVPLETLKERCDFSFTSPPYFAKEIYSQDETQSWKRYSTGEAWRDNFLRKMLELTFSSLKFDCFAIVNIADVKLKKKVYPLAEWTRELGKAVGFTYIDTAQFPMQTRFGKGMSDEVAVEPVIIFKKEKKDEAQ